MKKARKHMKAWNILDELKSNIMDILWTDDQFNYNNEHFMIPLIQEDAEYRIKKLNLLKDDEFYFMTKIEQIVGEYMEEI
jgi:hypothetical protein